MGIADVVAKAVFGVLVWAIAAGKSAEEQERGLLGRFRDQRLVGPRAIFKVQPAKCTEAVLALGKGLARKVRPTNLIGAALVSSHLSGIVSASANRAALHGFRFRDERYLGSCGCSSSS